MNHLARHYGPQKLSTRFVRTEGSKAYFESQFREVYGTSLAEEWRRWISAEREWQDTNLVIIREHPVTKVKPMSPKVLGSVSRSYYDSKTGLIYAAVQHPGRMAYLAGIHSDTGAVEHLMDVRDAALYIVASLAFDPDGRRLFYTTDNHGFRGLNVYDLNTRKNTTLAHHLRVGDLVFARAPGSSAFRASGELLGLADVGVLQ